MKALIVDDERFPAKLLKELIEQHCFEISQVEVLFSPLEAIDRLKETHFDLLFLDIEMPKINGIELAREARLTSKTQIIYTTAYSDYAVKAFQVDAVHYIVKPVEEEELIKAVRKAQLLLKKVTPTPQHEKKSISIYNKNEYIILQIKDIVRLEGDHGYTKMITKDKEYISTKRLGFYEKELNSSQFVRCHNSHIINVDYLAKISKGKFGYVTLSNGDSIPFSAANKKNLTPFI